MTQADIAELDIIHPSELKRLGKRVIMFSTEAEQRKGEDWCKAIRRIAGKVTLCLTRNPGAVVFTGHHKENDWSRTFFWQRGWHYCNRTGDFAVILAA
jgi:hypothetical protein